MMQTDVKSGHLNQSGYIYQGRARVKQIVYAGAGGSSGSLCIYDTDTVPVTASYQRLANVVTVSSTAHGLSNGTLVGIGFGVSAGNSATDGNYTITNTGANSFTITDPNSGNTSGGITCQYVVAYPNGITNSQPPNRWVAQFDTIASASATQQVAIAGEGFLCQNGIYANLTTIGFATVIYG
jgi:hypothetical protein